MPLPLFAGLTNSVAPLLENGHQIWQRVWDQAEELMKERPEEAERRFLEFIAATMEEERENESAVSGVGHDSVVEGVFQQCRLPGARLSLDPEQASIASGPAPIRLVSKQPLACSRDGGVDVMGAIIHLRKGERFQTLKSLSNPLFRLDLARYDPAQKVFRIRRRHHSGEALPLLIFVRVRIVANAPDNEAREVVHQAGRFHFEIEDVFLLMLARYEL